MILISKIFSKRWTNLMSKESQRNYECKSLTTTNMDVFNDTIKKVALGARFCVNFKDKSLKVNGKYVINDGKLNDEDCFPDTFSRTSKDEVVAIIEAAYLQYKYSVPSERSEQRRRLYFKALPEFKLSQFDMINGEQREVARCQLEMTILGFILYDVFPRYWDEWFPRCSYFWQSENDKDLVILKEWVF